MYMNVKNMTARIADSAAELKNVRVLARCALLLAIQVVLGLIAAIPIGPSIRISFGYLAVASVGALFGPVPAMINGALADVLGSLIKPIGPYFPGFTLSAMLGGLVYGLCFYQYRICLKNVLLAKLIIDIAINLLLNTLWLDLLYGKAFMAILPARALKNLLQYPVDVALLYPLLIWLRRRFPEVRR